MDDGTGSGDSSPDDDTVALEHDAEPAEPEDAELPDEPADEAGPRVPFWRRPGPVGFVPPMEQVHVDARRHPVALAVPVLRTGAALLLLLTGAEVVPLLLTGVLVGAWARDRLRVDTRAALVVGAVACVLLVLLGGSPAGFALAVLAVWGWLAEDVADWWNDRLVVTDRRVYRRHGWLTEHAPSMALQNAVFVDVAVSPTDRLLRCGTLRFDSAAQRDAPLARFGLVPDVRSVHHTVLELRARSNRPVY